jgi:hypothetical protein
MFPQAEWTKSYKMGFGEPVDGTRYVRYVNGLMDFWEIVSLFQDMIEAHVVPQESMPVASWLIQMKYCHYPNRVIH